MTNQEMVTLVVSVVKAMGNNTSQSSCNCSQGRWQVGKPYFIRTVTYHLTGRLVEVTDHELWLEDAAWIADDGRFANAVATGEFQEVEPFPSGRVVAVGRGSIIDATEINTVPRSQK